MQFQSTPETTAQLLFRLMVNWKRCERFFRLYIRFRCPTVVRHSICVRYLQFYTSIWNADTPLFPFRVQIFSAHTMSQSLDGQMASVLCFSVGLLRELTATKLQLPCPPKFYSKAVFQAFFISLYFNAILPNTVPVPFFNTREKKKKKV